MDQPIVEVSHRRGSALLGAEQADRLAGFRRGFPDALFRQLADTVTHSRDIPGSVPRSSLSGSYRWMIVPAGE